MICSFMEIPTGEGRIDKAGAGAGAASQVLGQTIRGEAAGNVSAKKILVS